MQADQTFQGDQFHPFKGKGAYGTAPTFDEQAEHPFAADQFHSFQGRGTHRTTPTFHKQAEHPFLGDPSHSFVFKGKGAYGTAPTFDQHMLFSKRSKGKGFRANTLSDGPFNTMPNPGSPLAENCTAYFRGRGRGVGVGSYKGMMAWDSQQTKWYGAGSIGNRIECLNSGPDFARNDFIGSSKPNTSFECDEHKEYVDEAQKSLGNCRQATYSTNMGGNIFGGGTNAVNFNPLSGDDAVGESRKALKSSCITTTSCMQPSTGASNLIQTETKGPEQYKHAKHRDTGSKKQSNNGHQSTQNPPISDSVDTKKSSNKVNVKNKEGKALPSSEGRNNSSKKDIVTPPSKSWSVEKVKDNVAKAASSAKRAVKANNTEGNAPPKLKSAVPSASKIIKVTGVTTGQVKSGQEAVRKRKLQDSQKTLKSKKAAIEKLPNTSTPSKVPPGGKKIQTTETCSNEEMDNVRSTITENSGLSTATKAPTHMKSFEELMAEKRKRHATTGHTTLSSSISNRHDGRETIIVAGFREENLSGTQNSNVTDGAHESALDQRKPKSFKELMEEKHAKDESEVPRINSKMEIITTELFFSKTDYAEVGDELKMFDDLFGDL
jgi:hypothetical protein